MRRNLLAALARLPASLALLAGRFRLTPALIFWLSLPLVAYQAGSLLNHAHSSVAGDGGSSLTPATLVVTDSGQFNANVKISSKSFIVDGSGASVTLPSGVTLTAPTIAVLPSNNITGAWVMVSSQAVTTQTSITVGIPTGAQRYRLDYSYSQVTTAGLITLTVNADGGSNYAWSDAGLARATVLGTFSDSDTSCAFGGNNSAGNVSPASSLNYREFTFNQIGNSVIGNVHTSSVLQASTEITSNGSCIYNGAAVATKLTVTTSAGTMTGTAYLWALK